MFGNCKNTVGQGTVGLSRAIYEYTQRGYTVLLPLVDGQSYDLALEKDGQLSTVQVRTTSKIDKRKPSKPYWVDLRNYHENTRKKIIKHRGRYDTLFVLVENGDCYSIPSSVLPKSGLVLGTKYKPYKLEGR